MMASLTISVALCTYNSERFLPLQLRSLFAQERPPDEIVVRDDGSTDGTLSLLETASRWGIPMRIVVNEERLGSTQNFQAAMADCRGDLIAFCDHDDEWDSRKLLVTARTLEDHPHIEGVFSDGDLIDATSELLPQSLWERVGFSLLKSSTPSELIAHLLNRNAVTGCTLVIRTAAIEVLTPIDRRWIHDYWIAYILAARGTLLPVPERLIRYRLHASNAVGITRPTLGQRFAAAARRDPAEFTATADRWEGLTRHLLELEPGPSGSSLLAKAAKGAQARAAFFRKRADALAAPFAERALRVFGNARNGAYSRYAAGLPAMLADIAFGSGADSATGVGRAR